MSARSGARIIFAQGAEFLTNRGTGNGGAILNHGELDFRFASAYDDDASSSGSSAGGGGSGSGSGGGVGDEEEVAASFTLNFDGNFCGKQEVGLVVVVAVRCLFICLFFRGKGCVVLFDACSLARFSFFLAFVSMLASMPARFFTS